MKAVWREENEVHGGEGRRNGEEEESLTLCDGELLVRCLLFVCLLRIPTIAATISKINCALLRVNGRDLGLDIQTTVEV